MLSYDEARAALAGEKLPCAFVDLDAFDRNVDAASRDSCVRAARRCASRRNRVRVTSLVRRVLAERRNARAHVLRRRRSGDARERGASTICSIAYPTLQPAKLDDARRAHARRTRREPRRSTPKKPRHAMDRAGSARDVKLRAVLCLDMALEKVGGRVHLGVRRSPLRTPEQTLALARRIRDMRGVTAARHPRATKRKSRGWATTARSSRAPTAIKRWIRHASERDVRARRVADRGRAEEATASTSRSSTAEARARSTRPRPRPASRKSPSAVGSSSRISSITTARRTCASSSRPRSSRSRSCAARRRQSSRAAAAVMSRRARAAPTKRRCRSCREAFASCRWRWRAKCRRRIDIDDLGKTARARRSRRLPSRESG